MSSAELEKGVVDLFNFLHRRYFGKYRAIVKQVDGKTGKIRALVPAVFGKTKLSPWAMPCLPYAGKKHGMAFLPGVDDGVWIEFEAGNPTIPIWSGFWWADNEIPPPINQDVRGIVTAKGLTFIMDDSKKEIKLAHPGGAEIRLTDSEISIKIGSSSITLTSSGINMNNGAFEVS